MSAPPLIFGRGLSKSFGETRALAAVDLEVLAGETHVLLGPSGCGKTTLLRGLAGFEPFDAGALDIAGQRVDGGGACVPPERRRIGMVFQDYALFPHLSVAANVGFGLAREDRARVGEVLELTRMAAHAKKMPHQLSGGEQQRIALARALAPKPRLLLLDEPFSNLDARLRLDIRREVKGILEAVETTAVFVTHDQEEALALADRISVMAAGRVLQRGSPEAIYWRPAGRAVARFVGASTIIPGQACGQDVETALGVWPLREELRGPAEVLLRPEQLAIDPGGAIAAEVLSRDFQGDRARYRLRAAGLSLEAALWSCEDPRLAPGSTARLSLRGPVHAWPRGG